MAVSKRIGKKSLQQNDFLAPYAPTGVSAVDVGTARAYNNGAATVTFTPDGRNAATSYTVTSSPGGFTGTGSSASIVVSGLQSGVSYTFTVTATNSYGTSAASAASSAITATTVPATPAAPTASSPNGANYDTVSWTAPATGGKAISNYLVSSSDGKTGNTASTSINISQEAGTAQTYTVRATNANGNSGTSSASGSVTTFSFVPFSFVPYSFTPYSFTPYSFTPYSFTPYGFVPSFSFAPAFGFAPYGFTPAKLQ
jgi:hypothetical protein